MPDFIHKLIEKFLALLPFFLLKKAANVKVTIPFYHIVSDDENPLISELYKYRTVEQFKKDLDFFQKHYTIIDMRDLVDFHKTGIKLPKHPLILTFDDGMREMIEVVAPILEERKLPATFFITTGFVDNKTMFFRNKISLLVSFFKKNENKIDLEAINTIFGESQKEIRINSLPELQQVLHKFKFEQTELIDKIAKMVGLDFQDYLKTKRPYLEKFEIKQLSEKGFLIGAHSKNHRLFGESTLEEQLRQTFEPVREIRKAYNFSFGVFAFPFNDNNVSKEYFGEIEKASLVDLVFSADGFYNDESPVNYHRFWMESTRETAKQILIRNFKEKFFRVLRRKNKIIRRKA